MPPLDKLSFGVLEHGIDQQFLSVEGKRLHVCFLQFSLRTNVEVAVEQKKLLSTHDCLMTV